jgi:uncharacterized protein YycO
MPRNSVPQATYTVHDPSTPEPMAMDDAGPQYNKGDFILTSDRAWTSRAIQFGQGLRFRGDRAKYKKWNHAAIIVSEQGDLVEALGSGVQRTHIDGYRGQEYYHVHISASQEQRENAARFAEWAVGQPYAYVTIVSIAVGLLTGGKFRFGYSSQHICSGLTARAQERTSAIFEQDPASIMPADLAEIYGVEPLEG